LLVVYLYISTLEEESARKVLFDLLKEVFEGINQHSMLFASSKILLKPLITQNCISLAAACLSIDKDSPINTFQR
jgi:Na+-translocating ferredoxin:NAD+ oxidoreductase RnfA subunit